MKITRRSFLSLSALALIGMAPRRSDAGLMGTAPAKSGTAITDASRSIILEDVHGNAINQKGLALVDWDGYMANPAVKFYIRPASGLNLPATVAISATEPRLYFNLPSIAGPGGPSKTIQLPSSDSRVPVRLSIFPDRQGKDQDFELTIHVIDADGNRATTSTNVHVFDQDADMPAQFVVYSDFSQDQTDLFQDSETCNIARMAAADWAYFIDDMQLDTVPAGRNRTWIYDINGSGGRAVTNTYPFTGFLLYVYGCYPADNVSRSYAQSRDFQSHHSFSLRILRSGGARISARGGRNTLGYSLDSDDADWWKATNLADQSRELFSVVHHEIGHALFFMEAYPVIANAVSTGVLTSDNLTEYYGRGLKISHECHFDGEIDPDSGHGAFGNEYHGFMPLGRWLITKLDLLAAEAVGYRIRKTFELSVLTNPLPGGEPGVPYQASLKARGGIPWYRWSIGTGKLPPGLSLDPESGVISGTPTQLGAFTIEVKVADTSEVVKTASATLTLSVYHHRREQ